MDELKENLIDVCKDPTESHIPTVRHHAELVMA